MRTLVGEQPRRRQPDSRRRAGDEADASTETKVDRTSLVGVTTLLLARHGETDWNRDGRWQGQTDTPLNDRGREQARALAAEVAGNGITAVYASDLARARDTAAVVAERLRVPLHIDPRLRELQFGRWEGLTTPEIEQRYPDEIASWRAEDGSSAVAGGETYAEMSARVVAALTQIAAGHPSEDVLVVLHGGPIRGLLAHAAGLTYAEQRRRRTHLANCDVVRVAVEDGTFKTLD
jgi:broad specificity phosphatase PhoE